MSNEAVKIVIERMYTATPSEIWQLWTTKEGFESWWGPEGFRADVHLLEAKEGGKLHYDMVADSPEMIAAMKQMGQPVSHETRSTFSAFVPESHLKLTSVIDFLPGVAPYENDIIVDIIAVGDKVRMVTTLSGMHTPEFTEMQKQGYTSQLSKLDKRYGYEEVLPD